MISSFFYLNNFCYTLLQCHINTYNKTFYDTCMKITRWKLKTEHYGYTQPVSLMLLFRCVKRLTLFYLFDVAMSYEVHVKLRTATLGGFVTEVFFLSKALNLSMK